MLSPYKLTAMIIFEKIKTNWLEHRYYIFVSAFQPNPFMEALYLKIKLSYGLHFCTTQPPSPTSIKSES